MKLNAAMLILPKKAFASAPVSASRSDRASHCCRTVSLINVSTLASSCDVAGASRAIAASAFGVLLYYAIANASAFAQREQRRYPRWLQVLGLGLCVVLACTLPTQSVVAGAGVLAVGLLGRLLLRRAANTG